MDARLECNRTLMIQKRETKSFHMEATNAWGPKGSCESAVLGYGEVPTSCLSSWPTEGDETDSPYQAGIRGTRGSKANKEKGEKGKAILLC